jgi:sulfite exporter TauE/SafE
MTSFLVFGFFIGLASNFHCIGMCGPLAFILPIDRSSTLKSVLGVLKYNLGRLFSYSFLGMIVGMFGLSITLFSSMQWLSITSGILIIVMAWSNHVENWPVIGVWSKKMSQFIQYLFQKTKELPTSYRTFSFGIANGLLPCGMVYLGLTNALAGGSFYSAILSMMAFGLGTFPAMFFMPLLTQSKWGFRLPKKMLAFFLTLIGIFTILRGSNLGIPYVSPKINMIHSQLHNHPAMKCCTDNCQAK